MATLDQVRNYSTSMTGLGVQALFTTLLSSACVVGFAYLRHSSAFKHMYNGRNRMNQPVQCLSKTCIDTRNKFPDVPPTTACDSCHGLPDGPGNKEWLIPPNRFVDLVRAVWNAPEEYIVTEVGLDAAVFLRFTRMCMQICGILVLSVSLVLIPIHVSFTQDRPSPEALVADSAVVNSLQLTADSSVTTPSHSEQASGKIPLAMIRALETYSIMNLPPGTPMFYFHVMFVFLITAVVLLLLYRSYHWYVDAFHAALLRQSSRDEIHLRTVLVKGIPPGLRSEEQLRGYFSSLHLGEVESVVMSRKYGNLERRMDKCSYYLRMLEIGHLDLAQAYSKAKIEVPIFPVRGFLAIKHYFVKLASWISKRVLLFTTDIRSRFGFGSASNPDSPDQSRSRGNSFLEFFSMNRKGASNRTLRRRSRISRTHLVDRYTLGRNWQFASPMQDEIADDEESLSSDSDSEFIIPSRQSNHPDIRPVSMVSNLSFNLFKVSSDITLARHSLGSEHAAKSFRSCPPRMASEVINELYPVLVDDPLYSEHSGAPVQYPISASSRGVTDLDSVPELTIPSIRSVGAVPSPGSPQEYHITVRCSDNADDSIESCPSLPMKRNNMVWERLLHPAHRQDLGVFQPKRITPSGTVVKAIDYAHRKLLFHRHRLDAARDLSRVNDQYKPNPIAYVTFRSPVSAAICSQTLVTMSPTTRIVPAPEPRDILWSEYAWSDSSGRNLAKTLSNITITLLIFVWIIPISLVVALANLEQIVQVIPFLKPVLDQNAFIQSLLTSVLPSLVATVFNVLFPYVLMAFVAMQGIHTKSAVDAKLTHLYYAFLFFNQLLVFVIGQTVINTIFNMFFFIPIELPGSGSDQTDVQSLSNVVMLIARSLPKGAGFFLGYTLFQAVLHALELLQINWGLFINWYMTRRWVSSTPRDLYYATKPWSFSYFYYWPGIVLIMNVAIIYSVIHPLILVVALAYFSFGYIVYKHQLLYCYAPAYETNGSMFHRAADWILIGLILFQVTATGVLASNQIFVGAGCILPIIVLTVMFRIHVHHSLVPRCQHIPIEALVHQHEERYAATETARSPEELVNSPDPSQRANRAKHGPHVLGIFSSSNSSSDSSSQEGESISPSFLPPAGPKSGFGRHAAFSDITCNPPLPKSVAPLRNSDDSSRSPNDKPFADLPPIAQNWDEKGTMAITDDNENVQTRQSAPHVAPTTNPSGTMIEASDLTHVNSTQRRSMLAFFHDRNEFLIPHPQTYYPPCQWAPLPSAMWLPVDPLHSGRYDLDQCAHIEEICLASNVDAPALAPINTVSEANGNPLDIPSSSEVTPSHQESSIVDAARVI